MILNYSEDISYFTESKLGRMKYQEKNTPTLVEWTKFNLMKMIQNIVIRITEKNC